METKKKLIVDIEMYHKNNVKVEEMLKEYVGYLGTGYDGDRFEVSVKNVTLGERNVDIMEVFDTIYREFAGKLIEIDINKQTQKELSDIYEEHRKIINQIKNEL